MGHKFMPSRRGIVSVRNEATDANGVLAELRQAFEAFKTEHAGELNGIKSKFDDVVQKEKVDRINADIGRLQSSMDDIARQMAAARIGPGGQPVNQDRVAHAAAFERFFRKGDATNLRELEVKAALSTGSDPDGGYTVSETVEQTIDRVLAQVSAVRALATVRTIGTASYRKLVTISGAASGWVAEKSSRPETGIPGLSELEFPAMELYANPYATQSLLDDSRVDIAAWLADEVSLSFAEKEGAAFVAGDGVAKPRGIASYDMVADAQYAWGKIGFVKSGVAAALSDANNNGVDALLDVVYALKQGYRNNASWLMNRTTTAAVRKLQDDNGEYLWQPSVQAGEPARLLGYPVADDDNVADVAANAYPVWFGDFRRGYLVVDRAGVRVLRDPYSAKPYVQFYTTKRVGGGVQNFEAIKALKIAA
jgi:HK97 family phage major capsid protein